ERRIVGRAARRFGTDRSGVGGARGGEPLQFPVLADGRDRFRRVSVTLGRAHLTELFGVWPDDPPAGFQEAVQLALAQDGGAGESDVGLLVLAPLRQHPARFDPRLRVVALELLGPQ